jgi:hypothetical protein
MDGRDMNEKPLDARRDEVVRRMLATPPKKREPKEKGREPKPAPKSDD